MLRLLAAVAVSGMALSSPGAPDADQAAPGVSVLGADEGGPRRWEVTAADGLVMRAAPNAEARVVASVEAGAILFNLRCRRIEEHDWCEVRPLRRRVNGFIVAAGIQPALGPDGVVAMGMDDSQLRASAGEFDETGQLACAQERGQPMGNCDYGVARGSGGDATVVVTFPNGFRRTLSFAHGRFMRGDTTMSGNGFDTDWTLENGLHVIRVDDQRFEVSAQIILGDEGTIIPE